MFLHKSVSSENSNFFSTFFRKYFPRKFPGIMLLISPKDICATYYFKFSVNFCFLFLTFSERQIFRQKQKQPFADTLQNGVLKNFTTFTRKQLKACNFYKKRFQHRCFLVNIVKFFGKALLIKHLRWLL